MKQFVALFFVLLLTSCGNDSGYAPGLNCEGSAVGGYCWYLGDSGADCDNACLNHGGYNDATRSYAGVSGSQANCIRVLDALGVAGTTLFSGGNSTCAFSGGCGTQTGPGRTHCVSPTTDSTGSFTGAQRACACNE